MNLQWILLAIFAATMISEIAKALTRPMHKNVLNLISIPVAFIFAFILQAFGVFQTLANMLVAQLEVTKQIPSELLDFAIALISTLLSPALFVLVYGIILFVIRLIYVNLISKFIEIRQEKKDKRLLKLAIKEEKKLVKEFVSDAEERVIELMDSLEDEGYEYDDFEDYEGMSKKAIKKLVKARIRKEKRLKRKLGFFKDSREKKSVSVVAAVVSGFLACAIGLTPVFYTMDLLSDITSSIDKNHPEDNQNTVYLTIDSLDEYLVTPYESTFVYQIYDSMGLVDLLTGAVEVGGKVNGVVDENGNPVYAGPVVRGVLSSSVRVATQLMSTNPNYDVLRSGLNGILKQPFLVAALTNVLHGYLSGMETPEPGENADVLTSMMNQVIVHYKNASPEVISGDIGALTDTIMTLVEKGLIKDIISGESDLASVLMDKDNIKELLGDMSGLSVYDVVMVGAFTGGIDMIAPMLGIPADNAAGANAFISQIINASNNVSEMTATDIEKLRTFFVNAATYTRRDNNTSKGILAYVADPLYGIDSLKADLNRIKADAEELEKKATELTDLQNKVAAGTITAEEQAYLNQLIEEEAKLQETGEGFNSKAQKLRDEIEALKDNAQALMDEFSARAEGFAPFANYFMSWMSVQKPFMLAGVDNTKAPLSINVDGTVYVCNTDTISLETMLDFLSEGGTSTSSTEEIEDLLDKSVDDYLKEIPMRGLLESLRIKKKTAEMEISPVADLVNFLIEKYSKAEQGDMTTDTINTVLTQFIAENGDNTSYAEQLAIKIKDGTFEYGSVTVETMKSSLKFGDDWTDELKKADSEHLVDIVFTIIDLVGKMGGESPVLTADESTEGGETTTPDGEDSMDALLDMLSVLGKTFDKMAETHCLGDLPKYMIEGLLKSEMLSMAMTPSMLREYMDKIEATDDFTYEAFMNDMVKTFTDLLDKVQGMGGTSK